MHDVIDTIINIARRKVEKRRQQALERRSQADQGMSFQAPSRKAMKTHLAPFSRLCAC